MDKNLVSGVLTPELKAEYLQLTRRQAEIVATVAVALSPEDRRAFGMMGLRSRDFTLWGRDLAQSHGQHLPPAVDIPEFDRDLKLHLDMRDLRNAQMSVNEMIADTELAAGYDAYQHALEIYSYAKMLTKIPGLGELVAEMGRRFKRRKSSGPSPDGSAS